MFSGCLKKGLARVCLHYKIRQQANERCQVYSLYVGGKRVQSLEKRRRAAFVPDGVTPADKGWVTRQDFHVAPNRRIVALK